MPVKGIAWAFDALRPLRAEIPGLTIVRLSQDAPPSEVAAWPDAERHVAVPPARVAEIFRSVDLFVGASSEVEGFGLPTLEAMACGIPCVVTDIGAFRGLDPEACASLRIPSGDAGAAPRRGPAAGVGPGAPRAARPERQGHRRVLRAREDGSRAGRGVSRGARAPLTGRCVAARASEHVVVREAIVEGPPRRDEVEAVR